MIPPGARRLAPGIYAAGDEMHVDLEEFVTAAGGDPRRRQDRERAEAIIRSMLAGDQIPVEIRLKDG